MGSSKYRIDSIEDITSAVDWNIKAQDDFNLKRLCITFDSAPSAVDKVQLWQKSSLGTDYDCLIRQEDPNGYISVSIEDVPAIPNGDSLQLIYGNSDGINMRAFAVLEL